MQIVGKAYRVSIYIGETDHYQGQALYQALLEFLRREGASGATVLRGLAGFGAHSQIHTATILTLSIDLPMVVIWIDPPERVEQLLPQVRRMVDDGLITIDEVQVVQYAPGRWPDPLDQPVHDVMRADVVTVQPETPLVDVVAMLLARKLRSLPVVDANGKLLGIITESDLLREAHLSARIGLQHELSADQIQAQLLALRSLDTQAQDVMTQPVVTVAVDALMRTAIERMVAHQLKRLPVVDAEDRLVGLVSRLDVFRAVEYHFAGEEEEDGQPLSGNSVADLMYTDVATVSPDADLAQIIGALKENRRRRAVVVDKDRRVLGIITDGDLFRRTQPEARRGLLDHLRSLSGAHKPAMTLLPDSNVTARELMTSPAITIQLDMPLVDALRLMLRHAVKRLPVVDDEGHLVGLLGRARLLQGLLG